MCEQTPEQYRMANERSSLESAASFHNNPATPDIMSSVTQMLRDTRAKFQQERAELLGGVSSQIRELRLVQMRLLNDQQGVESQLLALSQRLSETELTSHHTSSSKDSSSGGGGGGHNGGAALAEAHKKLAMLHEQLKQCSEETELVKVGLLNDRLTREERHRLEDTEDEEVDVRLKHVEELHDSLRIEVQRLREATVRSHDHLQQLCLAVKEDAPMQHQRRLNVECLAQMKDDIAQLLEKHTAILGRIQCVEDFSTKEEHKRRDAVGKIESSLLEMERERVVQQTQPMLVQRTLDYVAGSGGGGRHGDHRVIGGDDGRGQGTRKSKSHVPLQDPQYIPPAVAAPPRAAGDAVSSFGAVTRKDGLRAVNQQKLFHFYLKYNPEKITSIDAILAEYEGATEELFAALEIHYGAFGYFSS